MSLWKRGSSVLCLIYYLVGSNSLAEWEGVSLLVDNSYLTFVWEIDNWYPGSIIGAATLCGANFCAQSSSAITSWKYFLLIRDGSGILWSQDPDPRTIPWPSYDFRYIQWSIIGNVRYMCICMCVCAGACTCVEEGREGARVSYYATRHCTQLATQVH